MASSLSSTEQGGGSTQHLHSCQQQHISSSSLEPLALPLALHPKKMKNGLDQMLRVPLLENVAVARDSCQKFFFFLYPKRDVYAGGSV